MNFILFAADELAPDGRHLRLTGRRADHLHRVLRLQLGDRRPAGVLDGNRGHATVVALEADEIVLQVELDEPAPPPLPVTLVLALPRPKVLRRMLAYVAAAGLPRVILVGAWRVEKSYWDSPWLQPEAIRADLLLGLEQGGGTNLPRIELRPRFKPFVEDELLHIAAGSSAFVGDPEAAMACPHAVAGNLTVVIGPDAGFNRYELDLLAAQGCDPVHLGTRMLRVEHAVPTMLGRLLP